MQKKEMIKNSVTATRLIIILLNRYILPHWFIPLLTSKLNFLKYTTQYL